MNATLKSVLIKVAKQAVNASLITVAPIIATPAAYNLTSVSGLEHVGLLIGGAVAAREILVWYPVLLKWSQSNGDEN